MIVNKDILTKKNYITQSRYNSGRIIEYDIKQANINILLKYGAINNDEYNYLSRVPKAQREIIVGNMIKKDNSLYHIISDGILKYRYKLLESNNIEDKEIMRIANDAVYINRYSNLKYTKFDNIEFVNKGEYTNMVKILDLIIFSKYLNNNIDINVKGLGKNDILHQQYMISLIANSIYIFERVSIQEALKYISQTYELYVKKQLPIGFYRELNPISGYRLKYNNMCIYEINDIDNIDINYNISYIRELYNIIFEYFY